MSDFENISEDVRLRRDDLANGVKVALTEIPVQVKKRNENILVNFQDLLICGITIEEDGYRMFLPAEGFLSKTLLCRDFVCCIDM